MLVDMLKKLLFVVLASIGFSASSEVLKTPTFFTVCDNCTAEDVRGWFFEEIVKRSSNAQSASSPTIWSSNRVLVYQPSTEAYQAYELNASVLELSQGISPTTFKVRTAAASIEDIEIADELLVYKLQQRQRLLSTVRQVEQSFDALVPRTDSFRTEACAGNPYYWGVQRLYSPQVRSELQQQLQTLYVSFQPAELNPSISISRNQHFLKASRNGRSVYSIIDQGSDFQNLTLRFNLDAPLSLNAKVSFVVHPVDDESVEIWPNRSLSHIGGTSLALLHDYGGEVGACAVIAMNEIQEPTKVRQTTKVAQLESNMTAETSHLCGYIYGEQDDPEQLIMAARCGL